VCKEHRVGAATSLRTFAVESLPPLLTLHQVRPRPEVPGPAGCVARRWPRRRRRRRPAPESIVASATLRGVKATLVSFGEIQIADESYDHDVVIDAGHVRRRQKGPSKALRDQYGHTPLSVAENIPWGGRRLIIGTGADGELPIAPEVYAEAQRRGVRIEAVPTADACLLLADLKSKDVYAVLHVTC
jgi:hypothetical protein